MNNQDEVFKSNGLLIADLEKANITKEVLAEILADYLKNQDKLKNQASYFANILQLGENINSVKWRIKDPVHLLQKIVRKRKEAISNKEDNSRYMGITVGNYKEIINDLVGLRAIYLFKAEWAKVNDFILTEFKVCEDEPITIYYAPHDDLTQLPNEEFININDKKYILDKKIKEKTNYRSTHYLIEGIFPQNFKFELQTRSILEEAWGEIDHHVRYPNFENHQELIRRMSILNGALSACEQMVATDYDYFTNLSEIQLNEDIIQIDTINNGETLEAGLQIIPKDSQNTQFVTKDTAMVSDKVWDNTITTLDRINKQSRLLDTVKNQQNFAHKIINRPNFAHANNFGLIGEIAKRFESPLKSYENTFILETLKANEINKLATFSHSNFANLAKAIENLPSAEVKKFVVENKNREAMIKHLQAPTSLSKKKQSSEEDD